MYFKQTERPPFLISQARCLKRNNAFLPSLNKNIKTFFFKDIKAMATYNNFNNQAVCHLHAILQLMCNVPVTLLSDYTLVNTSMCCAITIESTKCFSSWVFLCDIQTLQIIRCSLTHTQQCTLSL